MDAEAKVVLAVRAALGGKNVKTVRAEHLLGSEVTGDHRNPVLKVVHPCFNVFVQR